jgi:transposase
LAVALAGARQARPYRRLEALLLLAEGHSLSEAARRVHAARSTLRRWARRYLAKHDVDALRERARSGRPRVAGRLTRARLAAVLARDPRRCGYCATTWTVPLLAQHLRTRMGCAISARTLRRRLHESDYRWKRPRYVYRTRAEPVAPKKGPCCAG